MREIKAIIRQERVDSVLEALRELPGLPGITVSSVQGVGKRSPPVPTTPVEYGQTEMVKVEVVVPAPMAAGVVDTIRRAASTGRAGDGKIFVVAVEDAIRISTGESGAVALS